MVDVSPLGSRRARRRAVLVTGLGLAILAVIVLAVVGYASAQASRDAREQPVEEMVPAFARAQSAGDEITNKDLVGLAEIVPSSTRLIAEENDTPFWVARGTNGDVCVLYAMQRSEYTGFSCGTPRALETGGLSVATLQNQTGLFTEVYLVPADVNDAVARAALGLGNPAVGLFTRYAPSEESAGTVTEIPRGDVGASVFRFAELDPRKR